MLKSIWRLAANRTNHPWYFIFLPYFSCDSARSVDRGDFAALVLLDLSAAFDTVDHDILLRHLESSFGIADAVLDWFRSYLSGRRQLVRCEGSRLSAVLLICRVPQGSVLGPIPFIFFLYVADPAALSEKHGLSPHQFSFRYPNLRFLFTVTYRWVLIKSIWICQRCCGLDAV